MAATHVITNVFYFALYNFGGMMSILWQNMWTVELKYKCHFCKVRKVKFGPLWSIWANILETVHVMPKVSMKHIIGSHIWSFCWPHDLWPWIIMKGQIKVILNGACYETSIGNHIWPFSLSWSWNLEDLEKDKSRSSMGFIS